MAKVLSTALKNIWRNGLLSVATLVAMVLALVSLSIVVVLNYAAVQIEDSIFAKIDVVAELQDKVSPEAMNELIMEIKKLDSVPSNGVEFVSKTMALENFRLRYAEKERVIGFLNKLDNPFYSSLHIRTINPGEHKDILEILKRDTYSGLIVEVKEMEGQKRVIRKILHSIEIVKRMGVVLSLIFILMAVANIVNTIRVTVHSRKDEVEVMKLVGASNKTIRSPFLMEGALFGVIATVISQIILIPIILTISPEIFVYFEGSTEKVVSFFLSNVITLLMMQLVVGVLVGVLGSYVAIKKYINL